MLSNAQMRACACGVTLFIGGAGAQAGLVEIFSSDTYGSITDWEHTFQLPMFDDMGGTRTLLSVVVTLDATIDATAQAENLETWDHAIGLSLDATVSLEFQGEQLVAPTGVHNEAMFLASPFDGTLDFEGPSGASFDLSGFADASTNRSAPEDLSPWIGVGTVDILGFGTSASVANGPGNVAFQFQTIAAGKVTVRYEYVPTPGAWTLLAASLALMVPRRRYRAA